jgi:NADH-quinone oxidoreductase subunit C
MDIEVKTEREKALLARLKPAIGGHVKGVVSFRGELTCTVDRMSLLAVCSTLKNDEGLKFDFLSDVVGVDYFDKRPRFGVVYHLYSISKRQRLSLKVLVDDGVSVPSVVGLWKSADCAEREAYDMFGIKFDGHPNLTRVYLPEGWEGYPLRKDYPLRGYKDQYNPFGEEK